MLNYKTHKFIIAIVAILDVIGLVGSICSISTYRKVREYETEREWEERTRYGY